MAAPFRGFRSLIENSPDAISLIDSQGEILYGSASTTKMFGYQPEELLGQNCLDLIHPEDRDYSTKALQEVVDKPPGTRQWAARVRHKDGNYFWVESTVSNLLQEFEVRAIVMRQRDINADRAADAERQRREEELLRANHRLEEFAYLAAHDLREPLRAISAQTELLILRTQMDGNARQIADFIVDGTARMGTLIDDLLTFATTGIREPHQCVELQQAVAQAMENLAPAIEASGATVTVDWLPVVRGSENHFVRLFQNLISNAVKYRRERPVEIHVTAEGRGQDWLIRIQDKGLGIVTENHALIFLPFTRLASREIPGSGLGLAVCKSIVEDFGGAIWVESELGVGSTFSFTVVADEERILLPN
jgi:PAS domain S-box-containing protein